MAAVRQYRHHMAVILIMCRLASATYFMTPVFMLFTPSHYCKQLNKSASITSHHEAGSLNVSRGDGNHYQSLDDGGMCMQWNNSHANGLRSCSNGWWFELPLSASTAVTEFNIVCNRAWIKPVLTSLLMAGFMIGGLVCGSVSDGFGRKPSLLVAMVGELACTLTIALTPSVPLLGVALFISGLCFATLTVTSAVLLMELVPRRIRSIMMLVQVAAFSVGYAVLCPIAYLLPNWRHMMLGVAAFMLCCYVPVIFVPESEMWRRRKDGMRVEQESKGKSSDAAEIGQGLVTEIATDNKTDENIVVGKTNTYLDFVTVAFLFRRTSILILAWTSCSFSHFGFNFNTSQLEGDRYLNSFLSTLVDLPGILLLYLLARKIGYIRGFALQSALGGFILLIMPFLASYPPWATTVCALLGKVQIGAGFAALYTYTGTVYPTALRNQAYGIASAVSRISVIVMPFVLFAGETFSSALPYIVMSVLMLTSALAVLFLPVTRGQPLPHTLTDAKRQHRLQWKPRCSFPKKTQEEQVEANLKPNPLLPRDASIVTEP